jgi:hypothetical protein
MPIYAVHLQPVGAYCLLSGAGDDGGNTAAIMMIACGGGGDSLLSLYRTRLENFVVLLIFVVNLTLYFAEFCTPLTNFWHVIYVQ